MVVESGCGILAVESWLWDHGDYGIMPVESWRWNHDWNPGMGILGVEPRQWNPGCGILAAPWQWLPGLRILAVAT